MTLSLLNNHGTVSRWEPGPHPRSSSRHTTELWTRVCQPNGDIALHHMRTTSLPVPTPLRSSSRCMLKAPIECIDKAGIQVKASKLIFGVREISFHNYTISKDQTRPKDENLCPIRNMSTPRSVTELKAFSGCTQ